MLRRAADREPPPIALALPLSPEPSLQEAFVLACLSLQGVTQALGRWEATGSPYLAYLDDLDEQLWAHWEPSQAAHAGSVTCWRLIRC